VRDCALGIDQHLKAIEADRPLRDVRITPGATLWELVDLPRIRRLRQARALAEQLQSNIRSAEALPFLRRLVPFNRLPRTPVFENVPAYYHLRRAMIRYLTTSLVILDEGSEERIKSTSRMYEQWVFLQIAAALRWAGLRCDSLGDLIRRTSRQRFVLDLERGTRMTFQADDGRAISLRYEPLILPASMARERRDTVYRGLRGDTPWCPDVLIEVLARGNPRGEAADVEYALVIDAKYARHVQDRHWETVGKYLEIRATKSDRQVVRQVWLAHPGDGIACRDPAVSWTVNGPNRPTEETIQGVLGLLPPDTPGDSRAEQGAEHLPTETARAFVSGVLSYLCIAVSRRVNENLRVA
jgi:hypothetical protein